MKIYLSTNSIPQLNAWSREQKHEAWHAVFKQFHRSWKPWVGYLLLVLIPALAFILKIPGLSRFWSLVIGGGIGGFVLSQFQFSAAIPLMEKWLNENYPK